MRSESTRGLGEEQRGRRLIALLATLAAVVAAYLVFRSAVATVLPLSIIFADLPPADHRPALTATMRLAQLPQQKVTPRMLQIARDGLKALPLAYEPFFIFARFEEQAGRIDRATKLLEEARRRRSNASALRLQLLLSYTKQGRMREALAEMDVLMRRNEEVGRLLLPEIAKLLSSPKGREALAGVLAKEPDWRKDLYAVAAHKVAPVDARALMESVRARKAGGDLILERELILQSLVAAGQYSQARQEWIQGFPTAKRSEHFLVFDGSFSGLPAPKPFGWDLSDLDVGRAEIANDGRQQHLFAIHFGGRDAVLAQQVLALAPGRYTLSTVAHANGPIGERRLVWRLTCLPSQAVIGSLDVSAASDHNGRLAASLTVPGTGCVGQKLSLLGLAGERPGDAAAQIERVGISR